MTLIVCNKWQRFPADTVVVDTTSHGEFARYMSPFYLGPVTLNGLTAQNVENYWQYSKVYPQHLDSDGVITSDYYNWRAKGFTKRRADRYPMGRKAIPAFSLGDGKRLDYIQARKEVYIPAYVQGLENVYKQSHQARRLFNKIRKLSATVDIYLQDFDGRITDKTFQEIIHDKDNKMGHAFVLKAWLDKDPYLDKVLNPWTPKHISKQVKVV